MPISHTELEPIQGASAREKTAVTMKSIQQLLEEEAANKTHVPVSAKPSTAPAGDACEAPQAAPKPKRHASPVSKEKAASLPQLAAVTEPETAKPRSFLGRLIGR